MLSVSIKKFFSFFGVINAERQGENQSNRFQLSKSEVLKEQPKVLETSIWVF